MPTISQLTVAAIALLITSTVAAPSEVTARSNWGNWNPPSCPADNGKYVHPAGSCACAFAVNCNVMANFTNATKFWERNSGELIYSLADCLAICNDNAECEAAIWTDNSTAPAFDNHHCFQTKGLGPVVSAGFGQVSYKGKCWRHCALDYINPPPPPPPSA